MNASQTINGTYGSVYYEGEFLTNVTSFEASIEFNKEELFLAGKKMSSHKTLGASGTGSMTGFRVNSRFIELVGQTAKDGGVTFYTELIGKLEDPEMSGRAYRIRLKRVSFDSIPLLNFEVNSVLNEEWNFTFEDWEIIQSF